MSHVDLSVTPAHLHELAAVQHRAAAELMAACNQVVDGDASVRASHGVIASSTAGALRAVQQARADAAVAIAAQTGALGEHLAGAARRYEATDHASGDRMR
ncbi:ESX-1 secretion-associated protein [Mycolicibacterium sp. 018/SC-01/001]|uniref:type VII secretion target n=1 Tax=Mycolicibacterium sp. 018/SC-01/001 TaxID=2592069 RepID=UPI00117C7D65|nr:type VII secretion target [Mycolicibacterium sp. 018/SC-01/001]TRW78212.1 ESX-1 secretion-associated protein [Mycolicibacterium sp. 018/SC-01/001]